MQETISCKYSSKCGGCGLLNKKYSDTLNIKLKYVNECLAKYKINYKITNIVGAKENIHYRNKMIIGYKYVGGKVVSGFYQENSHNIVDIDECLINTLTQNTVAKGLKKIFSDFKIKPYDEDKKTGIIRYVLIREAFFTKEILITLVTSTEILPSRSEIVKRIRELSPNVKTIIQNVNPRKTSIVLGEKEKVLYGDGYITDNLCGLKFNITSKSFYQINPYQTMILYQKALEFAEFNKKDTIIDAYSGVGTIGIIASKNVKNVISVENNKQAVGAAIVNAKMNKINNVNFICDDATSFITKISKENAIIDGVIMDPPRTGSTVEFLNSINYLKPKKIVYISCDPATLARDLVTLLKNYKITKSVCVDLFCWTNHVETVVLLTKVHN